VVQARTLSEKVEEQAGEISELKKQLADATAAGNGKGIGRGGKAPPDSRLSAKDREIAERDKTIAALRREIAQANERIARQASYYMEELRRLGTGGSRRPGVRGQTAGAKAVMTSQDTTGGPEVKTPAGSAPPVEDAHASKAGPDEAERLSDTERDGDKELVETTGEAPRPKLMERIAGITKR
jgi:hypothetical protein